MVTVAADVGVNGVDVTMLISRATPTEEYDLITRQVM
jgi:hypothetical protein